MNCYRSNRGRGREKKGRQGICGGRHRLLQGSTRSRVIPARGRPPTGCWSTRIPRWGPETCSTTAWPTLPSRAAHTTRKWTANAVSPQRPEQSAQGFSGLPALRIRPLFCFLTGSMVMRSDDIEQSSNNFGQCSKMIEDCSHRVRKSLELKLLLDGYRAIPCCQNHRQRRLPSPTRLLPCIRQHTVKLSPF